MKRALAAAVLLLLGCNPSPTGPSSCIDLSAKYTGTFRDSCGGSTTADVTLFLLSRCRFIGEVPGLGTIQGTVDGAFLVLTVAFSPCGGSAAGSAQIDAHGNIAGTYNGNQTGSGCCAVLSGSFTLTRQ